MRKLVNCILIVFTLFVGLWGYELYASSYNVHCLCMPAPGETTCSCPRDYPLGGTLSFSIGSDGLGYYHAECRSGFHSTSLILNHFSRALLCPYGGTLNQKNQNAERDCNNFAPVHHTVSAHAVDCQKNS